VPELPDLELYLDALRRFAVGRELEGVAVRHPALLRSVEPRLAAVEGRQLTGVRRLGKRLVLELEGELFLVLHLMIAGRLRWRKPGARPPGRGGLAAFAFPHGTLVVTEASTRKRASLHVVAGEDALRAHDPGGAEPLELDLAGFRAVLARESHTLKRTLTDPRLLAGIGNAYSDEILHRARLSPARLTGQLSDEESARLFEAMREVLAHWRDHLLAETGDAFPEKVTAFRPGMAVHGRYREPCPACGSRVQRVIRAESESHYCPGCQTGGRLLADRALSRLLRKDWPRTLDELERRLEGSGSA